MLVIGVCRRSGEYNGFKFDNYLIFFDDPNKKVVFGSCPDFEKVPVSVVEEFGGVEALQGADIKFNYNRYGKVTEIVSR